MADGGLTIRRNSFLDVLDLEITVSKQSRLAPWERPIADYLGAVLSTYPLGPDLRLNVITPMQSVF